MAEEFIEDILAEVENEPSDENILINENAQNVNKETEELSNESSVNKETKSGETKSEVSIEDLATQIGWNPNYKGEDQVDAATFILKSREIQDTMKDHTKDLKNQLSNMQGSIEALKDHNERVYRADVKRMQAEIDSLKKQKREAVELADVDAVDQIDEKINSLQDDLNKPIKKSAPKNPVYDTWVENNQWYLNDPEMAAYAEIVAEQYKGAPLERLYGIITQKVSEVFSDRFKETPTNTKEKPIGPTGPVEKPTNNSNKATFTKANLTPEQITNMNQFVKLGVMTEEQYIKDIEKMQEA